VLDGVPATPKGEGKVVETCGRDKALGGTLNFDRQLGVKPEKKKFGEPINGQIWRVLVPC